MKSSPFYVLEYLFVGNNGRILVVFRVVNRPKIVKEQKLVEFIVVEMVS